MRTRPCGGLLGRSHLGEALAAADGLSAPAVILFFGAGWRNCRTQRSRKHRFAEHRLTGEFRFRSTDSSLTH